MRGPGAEPQILKELSLTIAAASAAVAVGSGGSASRCVTGAHRLIR